MNTKSDRCALFLLTIVTSNIFGCSFAPGLSSVDNHYYQIPDSYLQSPQEENNQGQTAVEPTSGCNKSLVLKAMASNALLGSKRIVFAPKPYERGFYQYASWVEPPPQRLTAVLRHALESAKEFSSVSDLGSGIRAGLVLNTELVEFSHDVEQSPGRVVVSVDADLVEASTREVIKARTFSCSHQVEDFTANGAVKSFIACSEKIIAEVVKWTTSSCKRK